MARAAGISEVNVRPIWHSHGLKLHGVMRFKISNHPEFAENWKTSWSLSEPARARALRG
jgi:hypothetical protein